MATGKPFPDGVAIAGAKLDAAQRRCDEERAAARARCVDEVNAASKDAAAGGSIKANSERIAVAMEIYARALTDARQRVQIVVDDIESDLPVDRHPQLAAEVKNTRAQLEKLDIRARRQLEHAAEHRAGVTRSRRREPIPAAVRREVWRRDQGRCVDCGARERLEYDHIVPVSKDGSNTARNIELRCEKCNRRKGASI